MPNRDYYVVYKTDRGLSRGFVRYQWCTKQEAEEIKANPDYEVTTYLTPETHSKSVMRRIAIQTKDS